VHNAGNRIAPDAVKGQIARLIRVNEPAQHAVALEKAVGGHVWIYLIN